MNLPFHNVDAKNERLKTLATKQKSLWTEFCNKLDLSFVFHDHGLEGSVLAHQELAVALNDKVASDSTFLPMFQEIRNLYTAVEEAREMGRTKRKKLKLGKQVLGEVYRTLTYRLRGVDPDDDGIRKEDGRYAAYYHKFCSFDQIEDRLRDLFEFANDDVVDLYHPITHAAMVHHRFMKCMPYGKVSGKMARLVSNILLMQYEYPPAIIHTIERARYYEALTSPDAEQLTELTLEALTGAVSGGLRFFEEEMAERKRKREARRKLRAQRTSESRVR